MGTAIQLTGSIWALPPAIHTDNLEFNSQIVQYGRNYSYLAVFMVLYMIKLDDRNVKWPS